MSTPSDRTGPSETTGDPVHITVLTGSTRPKRRSPAIAAWVAAEPIAGAVLEVVDIADLGLPMLSEPVPAAFGRYEQQSTRDWSQVARRADAFVLVTPEYNASVSPALKNALDHLYGEWADKAVAFVGYGMAGGHRAVEHLRGITAELGLAGIGRAIHLRAAQVEGGSVSASPADDEARRAVLQALVRWATALRELRRVEAAAR